jgi:saccharopine dehydrogenase-like NADP-dependent oxidoreductase
MSSVGVIGLGAVGSRVTVDLLETVGVDTVVVHDPDRVRTEALASRFGDRIQVAPTPALHDEGIDLVALCGPCGSHVEPARAAVTAGLGVVSCSDRISDVRALLALEPAARTAGVRVVVGAAFSPGLSCVLASYLASRLDVVDEIHVAMDGAGGPACARQHHRARTLASVDWRDGAWARRPGGSGRELIWFPEPVAGADCYRAALADALLLQPRFPDARRITARRSATRQDRLTSWLPMLAPPPPEGAVGAVRVELRGARHGARVTEVIGSAHRPAAAAAATMTVAVAGVLGGTLGRPGARGLADVSDPAAFLRFAQRLGCDFVEFAVAT